MPRTISVQQPWTAFGGNYPIFLPSRSMTKALVTVAVPQIAGLLADNEPIDKASFSCCGEEEFNSRLDSLARQQVLLCGIETHVCIYQTAVDLLKRSYDVTVIAEAVSSRTLENKQIAINRMEAMGVNIRSTEMALFELIRTAEHPQFKQIAKLVK